MTMNSLYSLLGVRCIYTFALKFIDSFIFESSFGSMSDTFKDNGVKVFPKSKRDDIRLIITILRFVFTMLAFF